ncbi:MAG: dynamin family protein [Anaerolineae bacterium]|nr:dynamin family protein [Anaerolineae bacterium]
MLDDIVLEIYQLAIAARVSTKLLTTIEDLSRQLNRPTTIAMIGRESSGKSMLLQGILRQRISTFSGRTTCLNYFRHSATEDSLTSSARCYWSDGTVTYEKDINKLDDILKNTKNTIRIDSIEVFLDNILLKSLCFIDTPGLLSALGDQQNMTLNLLGLNKVDTEYTLHEDNRIPEVDAIIYVFDIKRDVNDIPVLKAYSEQVPGAKKSNILGVITKVDTSTDINERNKRALHKMEVYKDYLAGVIPVSGTFINYIAFWESGNLHELNKLFNAIKSLSDDDYKKLFRPGFNDQDLRGTSIFSLYKTGNYEWGTFKLIVQEIRNSRDEMSFLEKWKEYSGYTRLNDVIDLFIQRSKYMRIRRITNSLLSILDEFIMSYGNRQLILGRIDLVTQTHNLKRSLLDCIDQIDSIERRFEIVQTVRCSPDLFLKIPDDFAWLMDETYESKSVSKLLVDKQKEWTKYLVDINPTVRTVAKNVIWECGTRLRNHLDDTGRGSVPLK